MLPKIPNGWLFSTAPINHHHLMRLRLGWDAQGLYRIDRAKSGLEKRFTLYPIWLHPLVDAFPIRHAWNPYMTTKNPIIMESYNEFHEYVPARPSNPYQIEFDTWSITLYMPKEWRGPPLDEKEGTDLIYMPLLHPEMN
jgi:hypothetical protein